MPEISRKKLVFLNVVSTSTLSKICEKVYKCRERDQVSGLNNNEKHSKVSDSVSFIALQLFHLGVYTFLDSLQLKLKKLSF